MSISHTYLEHDVLEAPPRPKKEMLGFIKKINPNQIDHLKKDLKSLYSKRLDSCYKIRRDFPFKKVVACKINLDTVTIQYALLEILADLFKKTHPKRIGLNYNAGSIFFWIEVKKDDFATVNKINRILDSRGKEALKIGISINKIITEDFYNLEIPSEYMVIVSEE